MSRTTRATVAGATTRQIGVEHEYVVTRGTERVDFRVLIDRLPLGTAGLDPSDRRAQRGRWGGAITADGPEAEVVSPPVALRPGATEEVEGLTAAGRRYLAAHLPADHALHGFSTHLNVEVPFGSELVTARRIVRQHAPALMLLLDRQESPGLLVRPRPGRIEIGGEYASGDDLRVALVVAAAVTSTVAADGSGPRAWRPQGRVQPAVERFGWYIDRRAYGEDLYASGRASRIRVGAARRTVDAQALLEQTWSVARRHAVAWAADTELDLVDATVCGDRPLPLEASATSGGAAPTTPDRQPASPFGAALVARTRPGFSVRAEVTTWSVVVFRLTGPGRTGFASVPRTHLAPWLDDLDRGRLDEDVIRFLDGPDRGQVVAATSSPSGPELFDRLGDPSALVPAERDPMTGRRLPSGGGGGGDRPGKRRHDEPHRPRGRRPRPAVIAGVVALAATVVVGAFVLAGGGGDDATSTTAAPGPPVTALLADGTSIQIDTEGDLAGEWLANGFAIDYEPIGDDQFRATVTQSACAAQVGQVFSQPAVGDHGEYTHQADTVDPATCLPNGGLLPVTLYLTTDGRLVASSAVDVSTYDRVGD